MNRQLKAYLLRTIYSLAIGAFSLSGVFADDANVAEGRQGPDDIHLAQNGKSGYAIVVAADAPAPEKFAAEELQKYLLEISGARLPIVSDDATELAIGVGQGSVPPGERDSLAADLKGRGEDGYVMRSSGKRLLLVGNSPRASLYAVYHLLEKYLGCGWCAPGDDAVPRQATIRLTQFRDAVGPPAFSMRALVLFPYGDGFMQKCNLPRTDWAAKNRLNWVHPGPNAPGRWEQNQSRKVLVPEVEKRGLNLQVGGHAFSTWLPIARYGKEHPEYYALKPDGTRANTADKNGFLSICVSNPDVIREVAENISRWCDKNPEVDCVDLWHDDVPENEFCRCPKCSQSITDEAQAKVAYTKAYIRFINQVAARVARRHPKVLVSPLAYGHTTNCPADVEAYNDHVLAGIALFCRPVQRTMRPLETSPQPTDSNLREQIPAWRKLAKRFYIYEYYTFHHENNTCWQRVKFWSMVAMIAEDMRFFRRLGVDGISSETWTQDDWYPLNMFSYAKLAWNPDLKVEDLVADFCRRYYGKAAEPMLVYWNLLEEGLRESWRTTAPADWRDQKRLVEIKKALSLAENKTVEARIRATAAMHELAIGQ